MKKPNTKNIARVIANVILGIFLALCVFALFFTLLSQKDSDGTATLLGYQMRLVTTNSMGKSEETDVSDFRIKSIPQNSLIFVQTVPTDPAEAEEWYGKLKVGDVLTFRYVYTSQVTITHRIVSITEKTTGGYIIELAGDNKAGNTQQMNQVIDTSLENDVNYVIGKVTGKIFLLGLILSLLKTPVGMICMIIVPCMIIIILEAIKIANILGADRKKRQQEAFVQKENELAQKEDELEALRRRLSQLEQQNEAAPPDPEERRIDGE